MTATEITDNYKTLWIVEDAFGEFKGTLQARPVFHWTDLRLLVIVFLLFLVILLLLLLGK